MVGFDVPQVSNDMMLRFMGVDFNLVPGLSAESESKVGKSERIHWQIAGDAPGGVPILKGGNSGREGLFTVFTLVMDVERNADGSNSSLQCRFGILDPLHSHVYCRVLLLL